MGSLKTTILCVILIILAADVAILAPLASSQNQYTISWIGGTEASWNNWNNPANWDANRLPIDTDDVFIPLGANVLHCGSTTSIRSLHSEGSLTIWGGAFSIARDSVIAHLIFNGGTLSSTANVTVTNRFDWIGQYGSFGFFVNGTINLADTATAEVSCYSGGLDNATFNNYGTTILTGTLSSYNSSIFINHADALFDVISQADVCPAFINNGTVRVAESTNWIRFTNSFTNYGQVTGIGGSINFCESSNNYGIICIEPSSTLVFADWVSNTPTHTMHEGSILTGEGNVAIYNTAILDIYGDYNISGELLHWGREIRFHKDVNLTRFVVQCGLISNTANITVTDKLSWSNGGGFFINCTLNIPVGATAEISCYYGGLDNATFNNYGTTILAGTLSSCNDSVFVNHPEAVFNVTAQADVHPVFVNYGTICIVENTDMWFRDFFENYGQVIGVSGTFGFTSGSDNYGTISVGANSRLEFRRWVPNTVHVMHEGSLVVGEGKVVLENNAVVDVRGDYNVTGDLVQGGTELRFHNTVNFTRLNIWTGLISIPSNTTIKHLIISGGLISCPANITITDRLDWIGQYGSFGTFSNTTINLAATATAEIASSAGGLDNTTFNNYGTITLTGNLPSSNGSTFINQPGALFEGINNADIWPTFVNYGTVHTTEHANWINFWGFFDNYGNLTVNSQSAGFAYGSNNSGIIRVGSKSTLVFNPQWFGNAVHVMKEGSLVTGEGSLSNTAIVDVRGDFNLTGTLIQGNGEIRFHKDLNLTRLDLGGGRIVCSGNITINDRLDWNGWAGSFGYFSNATVNLAANATAQISCYYGGLDNATFNNYGTTTLIGSLSAYNDSVLINHSGALFDITAGQGDITPVFINYGTLRRPAGAGTVNINNFTNYGSVYAWTGTLNYNSFSNFGLLSIYVTADVITNRYEQGENGSLAVNLGNLSPFDYGKLIIRQDANIGGSLFVDSDAQVIPYFDWWYEIINTPQSRTGQFSSVNSRVTGNPEVTVRYYSETINVGVGASAALKPSQAGAIEFVSVRLMYPFGGLWAPSSLSDYRYTGIKLVRQGEQDIIGHIGYYPAYLGWYANFNLRNATIGVWDVVIEYEHYNPWDWGGLHVTYSKTFPASFTVEDPRRYSLWTDLIGPSSIRLQQETEYYIMYGNKENIDAYDGTLAITIPAHTEYKITPVTGPISVDVQILAQGTTGENAEIIYLWLYTIPLYSTNVLSLKIRTLEAQPIELRLPIQLRTQILLGSSYSTFAETGNFTYVNQSSLALLMSNVVANTISDLIKSGNITDAWNGNLTEYVDDNISSLLIEAFQSQTDLQNLQAKTMFYANPTYQVPPSDFHINPNTIAIGITLTVLLMLRFYPPAAVALVLGAVLYKLVEHALMEASYELLKEYWKLDGEAIKELLLLFSRDPNEKTGSVGFISQTDSSSHYIQGKETIRYMVSFENLANATAPAQEIVIHDQLDVSKLDLDTFSFGPIQIADKIINPYAGSTNFVAELDLRPDMNLIVKIQAYLNKATGEATWHFVAVDADTKLPPSDPLAGFLPPNNNSPEGQGSVTYWVTPKAGLQTGTQIRNIASITFDFNEPIQTNEWVNSLDNDLPQSNVSPLPLTQTSNNFTVSWVGTDIGSGIQYYNIYVSTNNGNYALWLDHATNTSATFYGQSGKAYKFYSVATDNTNNIEASPALPDATTTTPQDAPTAVSVTVNSSPADIGSIKVDGVLVSTPVTFEWVPGSQHAIEALSSTSTEEDIRYVWANWSNGSPQSYSYIVPTTSTAITVNYKIQYKVSFSAIPSGAGQVTQSEAYYDAGSQIALNAAVSDSKYVFWNWSSTNSAITFASNTSATTTAKIDGPGQITATFAYLLANNKHLTLSGSNNIVIITGGNNQIDAKQATSTTVIKTGTGNNKIYLGAGNNIFTSNATGNDEITTGNGDNTITISAKGNHQINTGDGNDVITLTNDSNNNIKAGAGNDQITVGNGNNTIDGGAGTDSCKVGTGKNKVTNCEN